jgi:hypothetical protein
MPTRGPTPKPADLRCELTSDGTPQGTRVLINGREQPLYAVQAIDLHVDAHGVSCVVTVGQTATDYGPAVVDVTDAPLQLRPGPTPRG